MSATDLSKALAGGALHLVPSEEKALRMIHGVGAPRTLVLERVGQNHPETRARLLDIELELFRQMRARAAAGLTSSGRASTSTPGWTPAANPRREKIVAALKAKKPAR
jgi:hypothetical protein